MIMVGTSTGYRSLGITRSILRVRGCVTRTIAFDPSFLRRRCDLKNTKNVNKLSKK